MEDGGFFMAKDKGYLLYFSMEQPRLAPPLGILSVRENEKMCAGEQWGVRGEG